MLCALRLRLHVARSQTRTRDEIGTVSLSCAEPSCVAPLQPRATADTREHDQSVGRRVAGWEGRTDSKQTEATATGGEAAGGCGRSSSVALPLSLPSFLRSLVYSFVLPPPPRHSTVPRLQVRAKRGPAVSRLAQAIASGAQAARNLNSAASVCRCCCSAAAVSHSVDRFLAYRLSESCRSQRAPLSSLSWSPLSDQRCSKQSQPCGARRV